METYTVRVAADGTTAWYQNGKLHRLDGPAVEYLSGTTAWYQNGKLHRLDGPAIEYSDNTKGWYIEGVDLTEKEFLARTNSCEGKIVEVDGKKYRLVKA